MHGVLNVLKPPGLTSHDVVSYIRRVTGQKKVGHTGTLDPGAAGVLPVCIGHATRIIQYLPDDKSYRAEVTFGVSTTTQDSFGAVVMSTSMPSLTAAMVENSLKQFQGDITQIPPMTSAIKHRGQKLYQLARAGIEVARSPRRVTISGITLLSFQPENVYAPRAMLDIDCSKGTYIRTICHDLGAGLGCGAHMSFLLRTRVGQFLLENTLTLEYIKELQAQNMLHQRLISMREALNHLPWLLLTPDLIKAVAHGNHVLCPPPGHWRDAKPGALACLIGEHDVLALAKIAAIDTKSHSYIMQPIRVLV